jgi:hypothetical protein
MVVVVCVRLILQRNSRGWGIYAVRVGLWWFPYELLGDGDGDDLFEDLGDQGDRGRGTTCSLLKNSVHFTKMMNQMWSFALYVSLHSC